MIIASQKRKENIAEYLLYMWQVEDMVRANGLDINRIRTNVVDRFQQLTPRQRTEMIQWYESIIDMMRSEGVTESGHLQMNTNMMADLVELHRALLADPRFDKYTAIFYKALPHIVELRAKAGANAQGEIETCFTALYGMLMMRLSGREISHDTRRAIQAISQLIAALSAYYIKNETEPLFMPED